MRRFQERLRTRRLDGGDAQNVAAAECDRAARYTVGRKLSTNRLKGLTWNTDTPAIMYTKAGMAGVAQAWQGQVPGLFRPKFRISPALMQYPG